MMDEDVFQLQERTGLTEEQLNGMTRMDFIDLLREVIVSGNEHSAKSISGHHNAYYNSGIIPATDVEIISEYRKLTFRDKHRAIECLFAIEDGREILIDGKKI